MSENDWIGIVLVVLVVIGWPAFIVLALWDESSNKRTWEQIKTEKFGTREWSDSGCLGVGFIGIICSLGLMARFDLHWGVSLALGLPITLAICLALSFVSFRFERLVISIIDRIRETQKRPRP